VGQLLGVLEKTLRKEFHPVAEICRVHAPLAINKLKLGRLIEGLLNWWSRGADKTAMSSDRYIPRKPPRFLVDMDARFRVIGTQKWIDGKLINLSSGGLCLKTKQTLIPHDAIEIEVETIDKRAQKRKRRVIARVIWGREDRYGMQFVKPAKSA
jgi:hypothetical protein